MNPIYSAGIWLYRQGVRLAACRNNKAANLNRGLSETFVLLRQKIDPKSRYIWIHAASLGEFEQGRPLIEMLRREHPELKILLTFFSPSGYEVRKNYDGADVICYLPFDTSRNVRRFLDIVNPSIAIFVKYEFWGNYLNELNRRHIPTYLISGVFRSNQLFFKPYGGFYRRWLRNFTHLFVQDEGSKKLLQNIGVTDVTVAGDTRFDRVSDIMRTVRPIPELDAFCGARTPARTTPVFIAGSSWPADEEIYARWVTQHPEVKVIIAPHEFDPERLDKLKELFGRENTILLSEIRNGRRQPGAQQVLVIDCFGLLSSAYAYADFAYIGGGFGAGLHNINEAAVYGIPVVFGPNHSKFIEAEEIKTLGGGIAVHSREGFERTASRLLCDTVERNQRGRWAAEYIQSKLGATRLIYNSLPLDS
ncbi:MAG: 3-deoxy-D-manno-octulosonic acid transferase [Muribaculaceae bacterium]|nr:3-deoxy-D-manno-octulosonic acid transferase [Muribaculaceae bacterium]